MEKHVYFVRHGQSEENATRIIQGASAALTPLGRAQAATVAERVAKLGAQALISSTFTRAKETAAIIGEKSGLVPEENELFNEWVAPAHLQGKAYDHPDATAHHQSFYASVDPHFRNGDHETFAELKERAAACFAFLEQHPAERIVVIAHLAFLRVLAGALLLGDAYEKTHFNLLVHHLEASNTGLTYVRFDEAKSNWRLVTWNDQSHLG